ncbi:glycoside hydrolase family 5 protein [Parvularcula marina]|uniref:Glycoside hydrolase family 5 protein n=1 Tax=Parvularcula marina TaxID=2292771 RepID=A0A371RFA0_9PROT|nr:glycoside hydrolase family 5 protein [Parvularcula marina]RFB04123.1 glycoside hydrolase family 5 protein [Parvularcula marina]
MRIRSNLLRCGMIAAGLFMSACGGGGGGSSTVAVTPPAPPPPPPPPYMGDSGTPSEAMVEGSTCINMGNALEGDPTEGSWGVTIEERYFDIIADAGFDIVRIPIRWHNKTGPAPDYTIDPVWMDRVEEVIDQALARNLTVIMNVHHYDPLYSNPAAERPAFLALWEQIAPRFQNKSGRLYFELINEPRDALSGDVLGMLNAEVVPIIRQTNPDRPLILSGDGFGGLSGLLNNFQGPDDRYIIASFHYYDPFNFTHQGATFLQNPPPTGTEWGTAQELAQMATDFADAAQFSADRQVPLFMGEGGVYIGVPLSERLEWYEDMRMAAEANTIPWCMWNFLSDFALYDLGTDDWIPGALAALGLE